MEANVMLARCAEHKKLFGIRIERRNGDWVRTWAFPIDETRAKHEGFDKTEISGSLDPTPEYPGCPYCKNIFLLQCTCGKMICCEPNSGDESKKFSVSCEWCGALTEDIEYSDKISVNSGGF
ncbi:MAG: hypothetical protein FWG33_02620 [Oscillospiraceae bacterium]|nr:hypothetical protein [Oscillospiraceae bacterium]